MRASTRTSGDRTTEPARHELPPLTVGDRLALAVGTRLILRTEQRRQRRGDRADRAERSAAARRDAEQAAQRAFEHRTWAGPRW